MDAYTEDVEDDTGTLVLRFGRDEGFRVEYDNGTAEVRFGLYATEAQTVRDALRALAQKECAEVFDHETGDPSRYAAHPTEGTES